MALHTIETLHFHYMKCDPSGGGCNYGWTADFRFQLQAELSHAQNSYMVLMFFFTSRRAFVSSWFSDIWLVHLVDSACQTGKSSTNEWIGSVCLSSDFLCRVCCVLWVKAWWQIQKYKNMKNNVRVLCFCQSWHFTQICESGLSCIFASDDHLSRILKLE